MKFFFETIRRQIRVLLVCGLLFTGVLFGFWLVQSSYFSELLKNKLTLSSAQTNKEITPEEILVDLAKIIDVPENETPTIATVSDVSKLANQPFFAKALLGDKVIFYPQTQKAILYRPYQHKVIEVASLKAVLDPGATESP